MKIALTILLMIPILIWGQSDCSNPWALNFNPSAPLNSDDCLFYPTFLEFDATLNDPITVGTGISNEHAAIANHGPVQIGLKVNERYVGDIIPIDNNVYHAYTGYSRTSFFDPTPVPGISTWDLIYSINLGDLTFNDLEVYVTMDFDPIDGPTQNPFFDLPVSDVMESIGQGGSSFRQGSENLGFNFWLAVAGPVASAFDPLSPGVYNFSIRIENLANNILAENSIIVVVDEPIDGCTDEIACNYNSEANVDDNTCFYPSPFEDCDGNCLIDYNENGLCDGNEVVGCTYVNATNYNSDATMDNGGCQFQPCDLDNCGAADFNQNGVVDLSDLFVFLSLYNTSCPLE